MAMRSNKQTCTLCGKSFTGSHSRVKIANHMRITHKYVRTEDGEWVPKIPQANGGYVQTAEPPQPEPAPAPEPEHGPRMYLTAAITDIDHELAILGKTVANLEALQAKMQTLASARVIMEEALARLDSTPIAAQSLPETAPKKLLT